MIYNSIAKDAMYSVKFLTNLGNCLSPCLFWAPYALVPPPLWCCTGQHLRPLRPWLCLEKSPLQSQNIYCNRISGLTKASCNNRFIQCCTSSNPQPLSFPKWSLAKNVTRLAGLLDGGEWSEIVPNHPEVCMLFIIQCRYKGWLGVVLNS